MVGVNSIFTLICFYSLPYQIIKSLSVKDKPSKEETSISHAIHEFGSKILSVEWEKNPATNIVLSPFSIAALLNLMLLGTSGNTHSEIKNAFNYLLDRQEPVIHNTYHKLLSSLQLRKKFIEIFINSGLFIQKDFHVHDSFIKDVKKFYYCDVRTVNFLGSPDTAKEKINSWISRSTKGKIKKLISGPLESTIKLVAANTIFFNATWENFFDSKLTKDGIFNTGKENITIPMMRADMTIPYMIDPDDNFEIIALPYKGKRFSLYVVKPIGSPDVNKLREIEKSLTFKNLTTLISEMDFEKIFVTLPRMKLDSDLELNKDLQFLGIKKIFEAGANFGKLTNETGIFFSSIIHKAVLEVTETGTVAAALTVGMVVKSMPPSFEVNKPSLLFIGDNKNNLILFWQD